MLLLLPIATLLSGIKPQMILINARLVTNHHRLRGNSLKTITLNRTNWMVRVKELDKLIPVFGKQRKTMVSLDRCVRCALSIRSRTAAPVMCAAFD